MQVVDRASACFFSVVLKSPIDGLNTTENGFSILVLLMFVGAQGLDHCTSKRDRQNCTPKITTVNKNIYGAFSLNISSIPSACYCLSISWSSSRTTSVSCHGM